MPARAPHVTEKGYIKVNHLKAGLMDDENTALWPLIRIKNPVSLVLMRPEPEVLRSSAHKTTNI
jgi:anti-sigma-K factor RskA